jgi:hypothetical protein
MAVIRVLRIGVLVAIVFAASGCGATEKRAGSVPAGAEFAPASAAVYISGVTDPGSSQWEKADELLGRFPGREKLLASARKDLKKDGLSWERDVKPSLGDELSLVVLNFEEPDDNYVFFTKPKDEAKFNKLLEAGDDPQVHRKVDGWTVFADNEASLDNFEEARSAGDPLSDKDAFREAMESVSDDAVLRGYVSGESLYALINKEAASDPDARPFRRFSQSFGMLESLSFSTTAEDEGVALDATYTSKDQAKVGSFSPRLDDKLPAGALLYVSFGNLEDVFNEALASADKSFSEFKKQRARIEQAIGFSLKKDLLPLFSREGAVAVYHATELKVGVMLLLDVKGDEDKARNVVTRLGALLQLGEQGKVTKLRINGVEVSHLSFAGQPFELFVAVSDDVLIADSTEFGIRDLLGGGKKLVDDPVYNQAREASGAPDDTIGFIYANLEQGLPYVFDLIELSSGERDPEALANTKPLQSALLYAKRDGSRTTVSGFLTIK